MAYNVIYEEMGSIRELMVKNSTRDSNKAFYKHSRDSNTRGEKNFYGTSSYEEAEDLMAKGWDEPLAQLKDAFKKTVYTNTQADKRRPSTGIIGYAPCVPNAIIGLPNSMISTETVRQKIKAVTLIYATGVNCNWTTKEMIDAGVTMLKIVNSLELQGVRVKVQLEVKSGICNNDLAVLRMDVKDWKESIDLKKLTFPLAHPAMLRRIGFRWAETCPDISYTGWTSGYGSPISNYSYNETVKMLKDHKLLDDNTYYINARLCRDCNYDPEKVMDKAGMSAFKGGEK